MVYSWHCWPLFFKTTFYWSNDSSTTLSYKSQGGSPKSPKCKKNSPKWLRFSCFLSNRFDQLKNSLIFSKNVKGSIGQGGASEACPWIGIEDVWKNTMDILREKFKKSKQFRLWEEMKIVWQWITERIYNFIDLWCLVASGGLDICVSSTNFKTMTSAGLNSLRQKEYQILVKNCIFDDPFYKKGLALVIRVLGMIKPSGSVKILMKWGCWGHWGHWGLWGHWGHQGWRGFKA